MSEPELERLEGIISREALYFKYHDKIADAKSVEDMEEIQFSIMEDESPYFSAVSDRIWKEFSQKENELSGENRETSGQDVQKPEKVSDTSLEPDIEVPVKQVEPQIDKTGAVNFHITDDDLGIGTAKEKFRRNVEAIRTLEKIESENRIATPEEQEVLSQYVGWGGLADAFDESKSAWANEYQELKGLLSEQEYASARESTLNAHYTSPAIIRSIYDSLDKMGFEKGNVLEPAMGIGNFFGMMPEKMQESRLYGVELDGITGRIAKQLYPNADIKITGFEKTDYPNDELADELADATIPADPDVKNYSYTLVDDRVYYRENSIMKPVDMSDSMQERIKGMVGIRNCTQELINLQLEEYPDTVIKEKQAELNSLYDAFSKKHGLINSQTNKRAFNQDSSYCLLCSLEKLDDEGNFKGKADMFTKRTIKKAEVVK